MPTLQPLPYGLAATIVTEDHDRSTYVPPPVMGAHAETCGCPTCLRLRPRLTP